LTFCAQNQDNFELFKNRRGSQKKQVYCNIFVEIPQQIIQTNTKHYQKANNEYNKSRLFVGKM